MKSKTSSRNTSKRPSAKISSSRRMGARRRSSTPLRMKIWKTTCTRQPPASTPLSPVKLQRQPDLPHQFSKSRIRTKSIVERSHFDPDQPGIVFFVSLIETGQRSILFAQARIDDRQGLLEPRLPVRRLQHLF